MLCKDKYNNVYDYIYLNDVDSLSKNSVIIFNKIIYKNDKSDTGYSLGTLVITTSGNSIYRDGLEVRNKIYLLKDKNNTIFTVPFNDFNECYELL